MRVFVAAGTLFLLSMFESTGVAQDASPATDAPRDSLRPPGMFAMRTGAASITEGTVARGQAILTAPIEHRRVGRLQNDIVRTGLVNSDRVVVPRGTPVYAAAFGTGRDLQTPYYGAWCGVVAEGEGCRRGYCMLR